MATARRHGNAEKMRIKSQISLKKLTKTERGALASNICSQTHYQSSCLVQLSEIFLTALFFKIMS